MASGLLSGDPTAEKDLALMAEDFIGLVRENKIDPTISMEIGLEEIPTALMQLSEQHVPAF